MCVHGDLDRSYYFMTSHKIPPLLMTILHETRSIGECFSHNSYTVFCRIHAPPQIDAPPKVLDHIPEVSSSKIYVRDNVV